MQPVRDHIPATQVEPVAVPLAVPMVAHAGVVQVVVDVPAAFWPPLQVYPVGTVQAAEEGQGQCRCGIFETTRRLYCRLLRSGRLLCPKIGLECTHRHSYGHSRGMSWMQ